MHLACQNGPFQGLSSSQSLLLVQPSPDSLFHEASRSKSNVSGSSSPPGVGLGMGMGLSRLTRLKKYWRSGVSC